MADEILGNTVISAGFYPKIRYNVTRGVILFPFTRSMRPVVVVVVVAPVVPGGGVFVLGSRSI